MSFYKSRYIIPEEENEKSATVNKNNTVINKIFGIILLVQLFVIFLIWAVKKSQHSYLYIEPYEPVEHGTFEDDISTFSYICWSRINSMRDFYYIVISGSSGFGSPNNYNRIEGKEDLVYPSSTPNAPDSLNKWPDYLKEIYIKKKQLQTNLEWEEFSSRFQHAIMIHKAVSIYEYENTKTKEISKFIKEAIPFYNEKSNYYNEFMRWKKFYEMIRLIIEPLEKENIPLDFCHKKLCGIGFTVNYLSEVKKDEFEKVAEAFVTNCINEYKK
ncbi:26093_t:CDS:2, partial [Dentiscutata erythropus]